MIPAIDPKTDYIALVKEGYEVCAKAYHEARKTKSAVEIRGLLDRLTDGDSVLDIGCGAGVPTARSLSARCRVTGVDISREMVGLARQNVPTGNFICADMTSIDFSPASFDAVVALYSVFHLPRREQPTLFRKIHRWLRPGGYLLCTLSYRSEEGYTENDFYGTVMYWSNFSLSEYLKTLAGTGFVVLEISSTASSYQETNKGNVEDHPLVLAQRL